MTKEKIADVNLSLIHCNESQLRKSFDPKGFESLKESIRKDGLLHPLTVSSLGCGTYEIVAGAQRFHAVVELGWKTVPCLIKPSLSKEKRQDFSLIENEIRNDLLPLDRAAAIESYMEYNQISRAEMGKILGLTADHIRKILTLNKLCEDVKAQINENPCRYPLRELIKVAKEDEPNQKIVFADLQHRLNKEEEEALLRALEDSEPEKKEEKTKKTIFDLVEEKAAEETEEEKKEVKEKSRNTTTLLRNLGKRIETICELSNEELIDNLGALKEVLIEIKKLEERLKDKKFSKLLNSLL